MCMWKNVFCVCVYEVTWCAIEYWKMTQSVHEQLYRWQFTPLSHLFNQNKKSHLGRRLAAQGYSSWDKDKTPKSPAQLSVVTRLWRGGEYVWNEKVMSLIPLHLFWYMFFKLSAKSEVLKEALKMHPILCERQNSFCWDAKTSSESSHSSSRGHTGSHSRLSDVRQTEWASRCGGPSDLLLMAHYRLKELKRKKKQRALLPLERREWVTASANKMDF